MMHIKLQKLLKDVEKDIEAFRAKNKLSKRSFCILAANNPRLLNRINSENVTLSTLDKALNFMDSYKPTKPKSG